MSVRIKPASRTRNSRGLREARRRWAELLRRIVEVDPLRCPRCGEAMRLVGCVTDPGVIARILDHRRHRAAPSRQSRAPPAPNVVPPDHAGLRPAAMDPTRVAHAVSALCVRQRLSCAQPADSMRGLRSAEAARLYWVNDPHWSEAGHEVVGEMLADHVISLLGPGSLDAGDTATALQPDDVRQVESLGRG